jgi:pyridoxal phosphate enzyme (YggS family)
MNASIWIGSGGIVMHITKNLEDLKSRIATACRQAGRSESEVAILAVSKRQSVEAVNTLAAAGLNSFGENYLQEALDKIPRCQPSIEWHFIGRIQSNKTRLLAERFGWVQTVASMPIAERLNRQRPIQLGPLNVCVQVNTDDGGEHGGVASDAAAELCAGIVTLKNLRLRGLMTIPLPAVDPASQRRPLRNLRQLYDELRAQGFALDTLSMGMTADLEAAVLEGSTMLRIGTALFGPRGT